MQTYGGIAAFGAGFLVRYILDLNGIYPYNYVAVLGLGALGLYGSLISMHFIKEPPESAGTSNPYVGIPPAPTWSMASQRPFRKLIYTRILLGGMYLALPFFAIHAQNDLGFSAATAGLFVSAQMVGTVAGGRLWGYLGDNFGAYWIVRLVSVMVFGTGALALAARAAYFAGAPLLAYVVYSLLYFCLGGSLAGIWNGFTNYIMDISAGNVRGTYIGLFNTIAAPLTLLTIVGGWILTWSSYTFLFALEAGIAVMGCVVAWSMPDSREFRVCEED